MTRRSVAILAGVAAVVAVIVLVTLAGTGGTGMAPQASPGQVQAVAPNVVLVPEDERVPLPAFTGETFDGGSLDLAAVPKPLVLNFWASWCGPCRAEQEGLELASRRLAGRGVRLVGVNVRDDRGAATSYLEEFGVSYPSVFDRPAVLAARLGRFAPDFPPYTLVVDGRGRVAARIFGVLPGGHPEAQAELLADVVARATNSPRDGTEKKPT
jgi:thiol-disulfide isomerase/thioredoxin